MNATASVGVGIGQVISISMVTTYYVAIMGITLRYLFESFHSPLPWSECRPEWQSLCVASSLGNTSQLASVVDMERLPEQKPVASAELYFL